MTIALPMLAERVISQACWGALSCNSRSTNTVGNRLRKMSVFRRIDHHLATPAMAETARRAQVYKDQRFSDHAPLTVDYDFAL